MDLVSERSSEITKLALDGLMQRQKAISANIANAETPGYRRKDVSFESQLQNIMKAEDTQERTKVENSTMGYVISSLDQLNDSAAENLKASYDGYNPEVVSDDSEAETSDGNNVNVESEMAELAKNGTKYSILTTLDGKRMTLMQDVIKGAGQV